MCGWCARSKRRPSAYSLRQSIVRLCPRPHKFIHNRSPRKRMPALNIWEIPHETICLRRAEKIGGNERRTLEPECVSVSGIIPQSFGKFPSTLLDATRVFTRQRQPTVLGRELKSDQLSFLSDFFYVFRPPDNVLGARLDWVRNLRFWKYFFTLFASILRISSFSFMQI